MPLYMDLHYLEGATPEALALAHLKDVAVQDKYGVKYVTYWVDYRTSKGFCLVDAPSMEAAETVHRESHGLVANKIIRADLKTVEQFLGKIDDTPPAIDPSQPPVDTAFRTILFTDMVGSTPLTQRLGDAKAQELVRAHNAIVRDALKAHGGSEIKHTGDGIMASFSSVSKGLACAVAIQRGVEGSKAMALQVHIGLNAGEPVAEDEDLFGTAVQLARRICDHATAGQVLASNVVRELSAGKGFLFADIGEVVPKGFDEAVRLYEVRWRD